MRIRGWEGALAALGLIACASDAPSLEPPPAPASADIGGSRAVTAAARERGVRFRAVGNEPGWILEVGPQAIHFVWDTGARQATFPDVVPVRGEPGIRRIETRTDSHQLHVRIGPGPCHDSMSGEAFENTVQAQLDDEPPFRGCGQGL